MANYKTGAQRYNDMKDKVFSHANESARKTGRKSTWDGVDMRSDAMKKALSSKINKSDRNMNKHKQSKEYKKKYVHSVKDMSFIDRD